MHRMENLQVQSTDRRDLPAVVTRQNSKSVITAKPPISKFSKVDLTVNPCVVSH